MPKVTLEQKRLETLRRQLYGKDKPIFKQEAKKVSVPEELNLSIPTEQKSSSSVEASYLKYDLMKILILTTFALGVQMLIYFLSRNNLLNLSLQF